MDKKEQPKPRKESAAVKQAAVRWINNIDVRFRGVQSPLLHKARSLLPISCVSCVTKARYYECEHVDDVDQELIAGAIMLMRSAQTDFLCMQHADHVLGQLVDETPPLAPAPSDWVSPPMPKEMPKEDQDVDMKESKQGSGAVAPPENLNLLHTDEGTLGFSGNVLVPVDKLKQTVVDGVPLWDDILSFLKSSHTWIDGSLDDRKHLTAQNQSEQHASNFTQALLDLMYKTKESVILMEDHELFPEHVRVAGVFRVHTGY